MRKRKTDIRRVLWTSGEVAVLINGYQAGGWELAYDRLRVYARENNLDVYRTYDAVKQKAWSMGLSRRLRVSDE